MTQGAVRIWVIVHNWTSLACTLFLLVICMTGLPLLFSDEINGWLEPHRYESLPAATPRASLDRIVASGRRLYPRDIVTSIYIDDDEPQIYLWMAPSWSALRENPRLEHFIRFDARTSRLLETSEPVAKRKLSFMSVMLSLHTDLFAGLTGEMFLAAMGLLFVTAIVSGVVIYGPFTRRLDFGVVRRDRARRTVWLDLHNLLGIATLAWTLAVGLTGVMNELSTPLFALWQRTEVAAMITPWQGRAPPRPNGLFSPQTALDTATGALPGMVVTGITFPGSGDGTPFHYLLWAHGSTPLTAQLFSPVLVDARTGKLAAMVKMPWYLRALELSRPLHFGNYGGLPLKIIWALLDLVTIVLLGSGLCLWATRPRRRRAAETRLAMHDASPLLEPAE